MAAFAMKPVIFAARRHGQFTPCYEFISAGFTAPPVCADRWVHNDFGQWTRENALMSFESGWLQNHRFSGTVLDRNEMELLHGLAHGDPPVPVR